MMLLQSETVIISDRDKEKHQIETSQEAHGETGPLKAGLPLWVNDMHFPFIDAMKSMGVHRNFNNVCFLQQPKLN